MRWNLDVVDDLDIREEWTVVGVPRALAEGIDVAVSPSASCGSFPASIRLFTDRFKGWALPVPEDGWNRIFTPSAPLRDCTDVCFPTLLGGRRFIQKTLFSVPSQNRVTIEIQWNLPELFFCKGAICVGQPVSISTLRQKSRSVAAG